MLYFATLFDSNYLNKGLALYDSLRQHATDFRLYVLCLDAATADFFGGGAYSNIVTIRLADLESADADLIKAKHNRGIVEYYFTLSPVLPLHILKTFPDVDIITTLDADILFYSSPQPIYDEFHGKSILITPHRFPPKLKDREVYGLYNVSFQMFRRDEQGIKCLGEWREQCLEWCYDRMEDNRFADQKYLDAWPDKFNGLGILNHEGAGLAPWNIGQYHITRRGNIVYSNNSPLIFYHFHDLKAIKPRWFRHGLDVYGNRMTGPLKNLVYHPYINALIRWSKRLKQQHVNTYLRSKISLPMSRIEILENYSTLLNIFSFRTIEVNFKRYFRYYKKYIKG